MGQCDRCLREINTLHTVYDKWINVEWDEVCVWCKKKIEKRNAMLEQYEKKAKEHFNQLVQNLINWKKRIG